MRARSLSGRIISQSLLFAIHFAPGTAATPSNWGTGPHPRPCAFSREIFNVDAFPAHWANNSALQRAIKNRHQEPRRSPTFHQGTAPPHNGNSPLSLSLSLSLSL